jgi:hypothetical protein
MKKKRNKVTRFFRYLYLKTFRINDTPQRIALGLGLGVFVGIMPAAGLLAVIFLAIILPVNRAAAILGALLTNTWLSLATFLLSIRIGSSIMGLDWHQVYTHGKDLWQDFHWQKLFKWPVFEFILPVVLGYLLVALFLGLVTYLITLILIKAVKHARKRRRAPENP